MGTQVYLCKVIAYKDNENENRVIWRDYVGNVWPIVIPGAVDGDVVEMYAERIA